MEVKINKEIRDYQENIYFGLNLRQFICSILGIAMSVLLYFMFRNYMSLETISWVCILGALPFILIGFVLSAYLNVPVLGIAIVGFAAAFWYFTSELRKSDAAEAVTVAANTATEEMGDDFDE